MNTIRLRITPTMQHEYEVRCAEQLDDIPSGATIEVTIEQARRMKEDARYFVEPDGPDMTIGERSAYRGLIRQIDAALARAEAAS